MLIIGFPLCSLRSLCPTRAGHEPNVGTRAHGLDRRRGIQLVQGRGVEAKEVAEASAPRGRGPLVLLLQVTTVVLVAGLLALLVWRLVVRDNGSQFVSAIAAGKRPLAPGFTLPVISSETRYWPGGLGEAVA